TGGHGAGIADVQAEHPAGRPHGSLYLERHLLFHFVLYAVQSSHRPSDSGGHNFSNIEWPDRLFLRMRRVISIMTFDIHSTAYGWLMLSGIFVSILLWSRVARRDSRLVVIYIAALAGAFFGAKIIYFAAEGWLHWHDPNRWIVLATGKSVTGALLGGYAAVEAAKRLMNYRNATGDWFAMIAPLGIMLGRVGRILQGCCLGRVCPPSWFTMNDANGIARWPAALVELLFNALML